MMRQDLFAHGQGKLGFARELFTHEALALHLRHPEALVHLCQHHLREGTGLGFQVQVAGLRI